MCMFQTFHLSLKIIKKNSDICVFHHSLFKILEEIKIYSYSLDHTCQTQAQGPNLAHSATIFGHKIISNMNFFPPDFCPHETV